MYKRNSGVSHNQIRGAAISVNQHLKGKCKFCPRGFERGEKIVFATMKNVQMRFLEADVEKGEPAGFGEQHVLDVINAHLSCAIDNSAALRSVVVPKKLK